MNTIAYLCIHIDTMTEPLSVVGAGIYSEKHPTSDLRRALPVCMIEIEDERGYDHARSAMIGHIMSAPQWAWIAMLLSPRDLEMFNVSTVPQAAIAASRHHAGDPPPFKSVSHLSVVEDEP